MTVLSSLSRESWAVVQGLWLFLTVFLTRGLFLFLLAYGVTRFSSRLPASFRHALWFVVVCGFIALPAVRLVLPPITLEAGQVHGAGHVPGLVLAPLAYRQTLESLVVDPGRAFASGAGTEGLSLPAIAAAVIYLAGVLVFAARSTAARIALRNVIASARPSAEGGQAAAALARGLALRREIPVLVHPGTNIPFACGVLRPCVVLPAGSRTWPRERLRAVLAHELAHVRRRDPLFNAVSEAVCIGLWFLPPVWIARWFLKREAEMSCDHSVVEQGFQRTDYARLILELASVRRDGLFSAAHGFLGSPSTLKERILRILHPAPEAQPGARRRSAGIPAVAAGLAVAVLAVTISLKETEKLFGTWTNFGIAGPARYAWTEGGVGRQFSRSYASNDGGVGREFGKALASLPCSQGKFTIAREWVDAQGNTWYQVAATWSSVGCIRYALIRVDPSGSTYESDESYDGFPPAFQGPVGAGMHQLFFRQHG
ncbi:MAG TPA: M56 family metallopeptidase [Spirochaetia bacterium]|nr:M56 family metallopeptidase [Spirochaetia bacterium]